jgi:hypothetical protein
MIDIAALNRLEQLAYGNETISGLLKPLNDIRQRLDRRELTAMQQHDLGRSGVFEQMMLELLDRQGSPIAAVIGPKHN